MIALGGGARRSARVRDALAGHTVVHLEVEPAEAWRRASNHGRPLARDPGRFAALPSDRRALYDSAAGVIVPPGEREGIRRGLPALEALQDEPEGTRLVWASAASGEYPVFLGPGLVAAGFFYPRAGRRLVVSDETVKTHVSRVLTKLGVRDRTQAVVAAYESGLVTPRTRETVD